MSTDSTSTFGETMPSQGNAAPLAADHEEGPGRQARRRRRRFMRWGIAAAALVLLFVFRFPVMTAAARLWIVDEPLEKADAVVVLGGGLDSRPFFAAELHQRGLVPVVLIADVRKGPATQLGLTLPETEVTAGILRKSGVPDSAIARFGSGVSSTKEEAAGLRDWLKQHPVKRIIIPTDPFHSRRVRFAFRRELKDLPVEVAIASIPNKRYDPLQWWKSEEATVSFQNEIVKLVFYWLHY